MPRILVVEPQPEKVRKIRELVSASLDAEIVVADSADAAEQAIAAEQPALVLTSAVTSTAMEARVMAAVRRLPPSMPVPVLTLPPLADAPRAPERDRSGAFRSFFSRARAASQWTHYDAAALGVRIREALTQSLEEREWLASRERLWTEAAGRQVEPAFLKPAAPHERAPRLTAAELCGLSSVRLAWGLELTVVNVSRTGMLIESARGSRRAPARRSSCRARVGTCARPGDSSGAALHRRRGSASATRPLLRSTRRSSSRSKRFPGAVRTVWTPRPLARCVT
jgi:CheY-like chemotaxis protein